MVLLRSMEPSTREANLRKPPTPFPVLIDDAPEHWQWPVPPFAWRHLPAPTEGGQPCFIESVGGAIVHGDMLGFDPEAAMLTFRAASGGPEVTIPFARFCRLAMTVPLQAAPKMAGAPVERLPSAAQEREYRLYSKNHATPLVGRTAGHVETDHGLYLFAPVDDHDASLQRVFVPRSAYERCEFGQSAEEIAASRWIAEPKALLHAIERQQRMPVLRIGQSLLALGLLTQEQLDRALAAEDKLPIGERLVAAGIISRADLQTAIAHKMGYPMVDLTRFPIDPAALAKLPQRIAVGFRALPLMVAGDRLIVAIDNPMRVAKLGTIHAIAGVTVVAVLAPKAQIVSALARLANDVWSSNVPQRAGFFMTTV